MYSSAVFTGGRPLCTQILPRSGCTPSTTHGIRKLEILGSPMVRPYPSAFPCFDKYQNVLDGQTDEFAIAYTALATLALRNAVKYNKTLQRMK